MKALFLIMLLSLSSFSSEKIPFLLDSISEHAIRIGNGDSSNNIYVFIDPMCPHSQDYISRISLDENLQKKYTYYIFLYRLQRFESDELIQFIYQSKDIKVSFEDVMIYGEDVDSDDFEVKESTLKTIQKISSVGEKLEINRRPYIIKSLN